MKFANIYQETEENMRLALLSLWAPGNHPMRPAIEELFQREPLLAEPVFQSTFGWEPAENNDWHNYLNADVITKLEIGKRYAPYKHQAESWKELHDGNSIVVTSGTGSGKTECFMYPVLSDLYEQQPRNTTHAIEAIFLYPLNALMADQKKRLSRDCRRIGLNFAVYNGKTPESQEDGQPLPNEVATRDGIRSANTRPQILLTNPSMLEYILVRQKDQRMLQESQGKLRWIVIDEAHTYSGSAAVELGYQIKRILDAFGVTADQVRFACTSATIGGEDGTQSLVEFIANITGQSIDKIKVIGGNRLVKPLNEAQLEADLTKLGDMPSAEKVIKFRKEINEVSGMPLRQIWEHLYDEKQYNVLDALNLLDRLCEMSQGDVHVLSLRAHFFMRSINGLYACANENCKGKNSTDPLYGHLTTEKSAVCPHCGAPLLEIVQCNCCGGFILMGTSDSQTHRIVPCEDDVYQDDTFGIDYYDDDDDDDGQASYNPETFYLMPYNSGNFSNPVDNRNVARFDIQYNDEELSLSQNANGNWVSVKSAGVARGVGGRAYCPSCGKLAQGKRLNFKHFRIPISFMNQAISPVLLLESAHDGCEWGKYIAFTDSRQGTAISAKTFNIDVEKRQAYKKTMQRLAQPADPLAAIPENLRPSLTSEQIQEYIKKQPTPEGISLRDFVNIIYDDSIFKHLKASDEGANEKAYKAALIRNIIGRRPLYGTNIETLGLVTLKYPGLGNIQKPNSLTYYLDNHNDVTINDQDWRDFLKICLDYFVRLGNHIQPLEADEKKYIRDSNKPTPLQGPDDQRQNGAKWPSVRTDNQGNVYHEQNRLVTLLCAGLGIHSRQELQNNISYVNSILKEAFEQLVINQILTQIIDNRSGYTDRAYYPNNQYVGCYYLDLSGRDGNKVCCIKRTESVWVCPVTNQMLDTTFCGYSPLISREFDGGIFKKYRCSDDKITMPCRPQNDDDVPAWMESDKDIKNLKEKGLWSDRHNFVYKNTYAYIAAEHSAQQRDDLLPQYTEDFVNGTINVLHCSTTMEMGVDIGDIDVVLMNTIPPTAANYLQRVGRAGRQGQTKAIAFSLCNNTLVGQQAFANPMWALSANNHMKPVKPSQTIIQRHINSYFFRKFVCSKGDGIQVNTGIGDFMSNICDPFITFLDEISTDVAEMRKFHDVFGQNVNYTVNITKDCIGKIRDDYERAVSGLNTALARANDQNNRRLAISFQSVKFRSKNFLIYLSESQFLPNANMPTGVVTFDYGFNKRVKELLRQLEMANDTDRVSLQYQLNAQLDKINNNSSSRDIRTALNEYAPGQTVVINEKNYISAGLRLAGNYDDATMSMAIYHCRNCGHTDVGLVRDVNTNCPICKEPYHGIVDRDNQSYTIAYEPIGFRADNNNSGTREEKTEKQFYDIRPILLETNWNTYSEINMCQMIASGENGNILFYNKGAGQGFAYCKSCGRAAVEHSYGWTDDSMPYKLRPGHTNLASGGRCTPNVDRHVVIIGKHPTCYVALRFKKDAGSDEFEDSKELVYSLGVVLRRALADYLGIDEGEIDFGTKEERYSQGRETYVLFIYDTAKGGCGYSLTLMDPAASQKIFDEARKMLEDADCTCETGDGACTKCLVDRTNYRNVKLLSKSKALTWLNKQKSGIRELPQTVNETYPDAAIIYRSMKQLFKQYLEDSNATEITLCVSDLTDDMVVTEWNSLRSEMGKYINKAVQNGKTINLKIEYHPELHSSLVERLPFINLQGRFTDCNVQLVKDMGELKTAIIVKSGDKTYRYFTDKTDALSFSNNWGKDYNHIFVDSTSIDFEQQDEPTYEVAPNSVLRQGLTKATMFQVQNYFSKAIAYYVLKPEDIDMMQKVLGGKNVSITFSDMYVNSALASLMLVYLIDEMRNLFGFTIDNVTLQLGSDNRKWKNERFNDWTYINLNFNNNVAADEYTDALFKKVLGVNPEHSSNNADHHRWLRIEAGGGGKVEIRPDHGISGGYRSHRRYSDLKSLDGTVDVVRNNEDVLYYVIIEK